MLYKPTYCCDCGDKIDRTEWNLLTSRRFCDLCSTEHSFDDWFGRLAAAGFLLIGVFGLGAYFSAGEKSIEIARSGKPALKANSNRQSERIVANPKRPGKNDVYGLKGATNVETKPYPARSIVVPEVERNTPKRRVQKVTSEPVYFCGAKTKKGSPCSRRVRGGGRCWQHEGKHAILPKKDLLIKKE